MAKVVSERVVAEAAYGDEMAQAWVGNVSRDVVKQPVMTLPYGATRSGMKDQIIAKLKKMFDDGKNPFHKKVANFHAEAQYLSKVVYESIGIVVKAARVAMGWLQAAADVAAQDGIPIHWVTPAGLPVLQAYHKSTAKEVQMYCSGRRVAVTVGVPTSEISKAKMKSAISPNWVHSLDASHLMLTTIS